MTSRIGSPDTPADVEVRACLDGKVPRSFVMVAGAGSGKTTSLIKALDHLVCAEAAYLGARCSYRARERSGGRKAADSQWRDRGFSATRNHHVSIPVLDHPS